MNASAQDTPFRALLISLAALAVPVAGTFWVPEAFQDYEALLWLLAVVPAFLLSYHKGWRGVAASLAGAMAVISVTYAVMQATGHHMPELMLPVIFILIALFLGIGALAERFRRDSDRHVTPPVGFTDPTTGLPNQSHAELHLEIEFSAAQRGRPLAIVIFDLDDFEGFNARHGDIAGDEVLRLIGYALRKTTRRMNLSARFHDASFICVLGGSDDDGAISFVTRFQQALQQSPIQRPMPPISGGIASYSPSMKTHRDLVGAAEGALKQANKEGRGRIRVHGRKLNMPMMVIEPAAAAAETAPVAMPQGRGRGRKALIVAEQAPVRALLARYLTDHGFTVAQVSNVVDGVQCLTIEYDMLFTDISLHEAIGVELVRAGKLRWPSMQVVGLVHPTHGALDIDALNSGIDRYLLMPLDLPRVRAHITELLERRDRLVTSMVESRQLSMEYQARANDVVEALRQSEEASQSLIAALTDQVVRLRKDGTGLDKFPASETGVLLMLMERALATSQVQVHEYRVIDGDSVREFEVRLAASGDDAVIAIVRNTTDRRNLEEQLRQSQKLEAIGRLAGGLAHDFNNLLTVVQGNAHLLSEETQATQSTREYVEQIATAAERGATLVRQLLAFGRRQVLQPTVLNLNAVVEGTQAMLVRLIGENIRLEVDLEHDLGLIKADAGQLEQVLVNLAVNARDVLADGGLLRITTRNGVLAGHGAADGLGDDVVLLTVSDNGPGMDAETRERIFEPFFTTRGLAKASGLGLATVYGIVRQSGGTISVQSERGHGTSFEIAFPRITQ